MWEPILANKSGKTTEFGHVFVTKSVRFGRTELSLRLSECSRRDLAIEKGLRPVFLKNKINKYDFSYGLEVKQRKKHSFVTKSVVKAIGMLMARSSD